MMKALALALALLSGSALACSCRIETEIFPPSSSIIPTNVQFQLTHGFRVSASPTLSREDGTVVPTLETTRSTTWITLAPLQPLEPNTKYTVTTTGGPDGMEFFGFTTTDGPDETPPEPRRFSSFVREVSPGGSSCGPGESIRFNLSARVEPATTLVMMSGVNSQQLSEVPTALIGEFGLFEGGCGRNFALLKTGDLAIDLRVIDFAGNLSTTPEVHQLKTAGCSATPGLFAPLVLAFFLARKRSRRQR